MHNYLKFIIYTVFSYWTTDRNINGLFENVFKRIIREFSNLFMRVFSHGQVNSIHNNFIYFKCNNKIICKWKIIPCLIYKSLGGFFLLLFFSCIANDFIRTVILFMFTSSLKSFSRQINQLVKKEKVVLVLSF